MYIPFASYMYIPFASYMYVSCLFYIMNVRKAAVMCVLCS